MTPITYHSDQAADWAKALDEADTLDKLKRAAHDWKEVAADAHEIASKMTQDDFKVWRAGMKKERRGQFAGEKFAVKYGALSMPGVLFKVSIMAHKYHVPWGLMYLRLKETGNLDKALA